MFAAFGRGTVVGSEHDDGVVQLAHFLQMRDHPADMVVGLLHEAGKHLHLPCVEFLRVGRQAVPCLDLIRARGKLGARRHDARFELARKYLLAPFVPTLVKLAAIALDPFTLHLMRCMPGTEAVVHEEWLGGRHGAQVHQVFDGTVGEVGIEVVALVTGKRRRDVVAVMHQRG